MTLLLPAQAATLANRVYDVQSDTQWERIVKARGSAGSVGLYGFDLNPKRIKGVTGGRFIKDDAGLGFLAMGSGKRQGEALVAIHGTASLADGITDANCSFDLSPGGHLVHRGFALAYKSMQQEIVGYFQQKGHNPSQIHVVGHSLGGALATLAAEQFALAGHGVTLYTFGAPRVGNTHYTNVMRQMLGANNIRRVYHEADPVSMVPIYPFTPLPNNGTGHCLPWNGWQVSLYAHFMENYIASIGECHWNSLPQASKLDFFGSIEAWLTGVAEGSNTVGMFSAKALRMIFRALCWIIEKVMAIGAATLQFAASGGAIVVDALSYLLYSGCLLGDKVERHVSALISAIMQFMGRTVRKGTNMTMAFIRWVLDLFSNILSTMALQALQRVYSTRR